MTLAEIIFTIFLIVHIRYFISLFNKKRLKEIKKITKKLDKMRKISVKTLDQQKKFLDVRYPKNSKIINLSWRMLPQIAVSVLIFFLVYRGMQYGVLQGWWSIPMWFALLSIFVFPIVINLILKKFDIQRGMDIGYLIRGGAK